MPAKKPSRQPESRILEFANLTLFLALAFLLGCFRQIDMDIWWHLRAGALIQESGIPTQDTFTIGASGNQWIDLHWLFQKAAYAVFQSGGMEALTLCSATLATIAVAILQLARRPEWSRTFFIAVWVPYLILLGGRFYIRPEIVTLVCLASYITVLFKGQTKISWLWLLVPIQLLWVNVQGLFILGPVLLAFYMLERLVLWLRAPKKVALRQPILVTLLVLFACFINPYTYRGALFPFELFQKMSSESELYSNHIAELKGLAQFIRESGLLHLYVLLHLSLMVFGAISFVLVWSRGQFSLFRLVSFVAFTWLGSQATRNSPQFVVVCGSILAWNLSEFLSRSNSAKATHTVVSSRLQLSLGGLLLTLIVAVYSGIFYRVAGEGRLVGLREQPLWHAHAAARVATGPGAPQRILAFHLGQAALVEYYMREDQRVYCDPRLEVMGRKTFEKYHEIQALLQSNSPQWPGVLTARDLQCVLADHRTQVEAALLIHPQWRCVHFDPVAGVYVRSDLAQQMLPIDFLDRYARLQWLAAADQSPKATLREAEAIVAITLQLQEEEGRNHSLVLPFLLCGARLAQPAVDDPDPKRWRIWGSCFYHWAFQLRGASAGDLNDFLDNPRLLLSAARARSGLARAYELDPHDQKTITYSLQLAELIGDRGAASHWAARLLENPPRRLNDQPEIIAKLERTRRLERLTTTRVRNLSDLDEVTARLLADGRVGRAVATFESFVDGNAKLPWQLANRYASLLALSGRMDQARELWANQDSADQVAVDRRNRMGVASMFFNDLQSAEAHFDVARSAAPDNPHAIWGQISTHLEAGHLSRAKSLARETLEKPDLPTWLRSEFSFITRRQAVTPE